jgi:hypothetical protein
MNISDYRETNNLQFDETSRIEHLVSGLVVCDTTWSGKWLPMSQRNVVSPHYAG